MDSIFYQYPFVSLIVLSITIVVSLAGLLYQFYIKPNDIRLTIMQQNIEELRDQVIKFELREHKRAKRISEKRRLLKEQQATISPRLEDVSCSENKPLKVVVNDLKSLLDKWNDKALTKLQRKNIEESYIGKKVTWEVKIMSVSEEKDDKIWVTIVPRTTSLGIDSAHAVFDTMFKKRLLDLKNGEAVVITGIVERFFLAPVIGDCFLVKSSKSTQSKLIRASA